MLELSVLLKSFRKICALGCLGWRGRGIDNLWNWHLGPLHYVAKLKIWRGRNFGTRKSNITQPLIFVSLIRPRIIPWTPSDAQTPNFRTARLRPLMPTLTTWNQHNEFFTHVEVQLTKLQNIPRLPTNLCFRGSIFDSKF